MRIYFFRKPSSACSNPLFLKQMLTVLWLGLARSLSLLGGHLLTVKKKKKDKAKKAVLLLEPFLVAPSFSWSLHHEHLASCVLLPCSLQALQGLLIFR